MTVARSAAIALIDPSDYTDSVQLWCRRGHL
jgi:hypothetical protein